MGLDTQEIKLTEGKTYHSDRSGLLFKVIKIYHTNEDYVKVKGVIMDKFTSEHYETKTYKLMKKRIHHWKELRKCEFCKVPCGKEWCRHCDCSK